MENAFECIELTKRFGGTAALDNVGLVCKPGKVIGLLGPNGSGKTTLIKLANGLLSPTKGEVRICGYRPGRESKSLVSYLPDRPCLPEWMSTEQVCDFYGDFYRDFDREKAERMIEELRLPENIKIGQMSKGTKEKLQLIMVMSRHARLFLLDEPIGGVDPATRDYILHTIITNYDPDAAVIISTHLISEVENILDEAIFINHGRVLLHSSVDDIREQCGKSVDAYFREVFKC